MVWFLVATVIAVVDDDDDEVANVLLFLTLFCLFLFAVGRCSVFMLVL